MSLKGLRFTLEVDGQEPDTFAELMLTLADIPYQFVDVSGFDHEGTSRDLLKTLNPLCQVPTLAL
ncbi:glutathione S-transferase [Escherichia coli]|nr:glutathione S-transferase [Escherichia coli]